MFVPPQLFRRHNELSRLTYLERKKNPELKTQIRMGEKDLILLVKIKGDKEWELEEDIHAFGKLPSIEWFRNWPSREMPEITSPPKGRNTKAAKNVHDLSLSPTNEQSTPKKLKTSDANIAKKFGKSDLC